MSSNFPQFSESAYQPSIEPPARRSGCKTWMILMAALGGSVLLGLLACCGLIYVGMTGISSRPPTDQERQAVVTIDDLRNHGVEAARQEEREVWLTKRN